MAWRDYDLSLPQSCFRGELPGPIQPGAWSLPNSCPDERGKMEPAKKVQHSLDDVIENALKSILRDEEAPFWLYQAARDYAERYDPRHGTGLIPSSAPMMQEITESGELVGKRPALADSVWVDAGWTSAPRIAVFRSGAFDPVETGGVGEVRPVEVSLEAMRIHGAYGYSKEFVVERKFQAARIAPVADTRRNVLTVCNRCRRKEVPERCIVLVEQPRDVGIVASFRSVPCAAADCKIQGFAGSDGPGYSFEMIGRPYIIMADIGNPAPARCAYAFIVGKALAAGILRQVQPFDLFRRK